MAEKLLSPKLRVDEAPLEADLRPRTLDEFVGQEKMKENLAIFLEAARARGEALEHLLLCGPPGLGKTTLANIVAKEMGVGIRITSGPAVEKVRDFATVVSKLDRYEVLFVDEVHRLPRPVEEMLYPAMEDRRLDIIVGKGLQARTLRLPLNPFTVIGATTRTALLTSPLRARFGVTYRLDFYDVESMERIVHRSAGILGVEIDDKAAREIAERSRGTPRVANRLLKRLRDYAEVRAEGKITLQVAREALELLEVDRLGLDEVDRKVIETVIGRFDGGPVGLDAIAAAVGEESDTIMDVHEPYLLRLGFIDRTPRGRIAARPAYEHLGLPFASSANVPNQEREQPSLL